jgi:archaellum component FlaC
MDNNNNNNMFKEDQIVDIGNLTGGVKSHMDGEKHTLKEMLERIEELEEVISDIKYFLSNPRKLNY